MKRSAIFCADDATGTGVARPSGVLDLSIFFHLSFLLVLFMQGILFQKS